MAPHQQETFKPYAARIFRDTKAGDGSDAYFEILKDGKRVYSQKASGTGDKFFIGTMYPDDPDAALVKVGTDITGNGQPDLVVSEWSGYANCCLTLHIFELGPTVRELGAIDAQFGDSGPHFLAPDKNSKNAGLAILIHDWTFANWNTDFADSPAPKVFLRYTDNAYRVAPDLMRPQVLEVRDLGARADEVRNYAPSAKGGVWPRTDISPQLWATMLDLIYSGHADAAWKFLDAAWPGRVQGKDVFARDFRAQLAKSPYWPAVEAIQTPSSPTSPRAGAE
ncbi:MAG: hypothetical protein ACREQH_13445 [Candidatus Binatus sp.]